MTIKLIHPQLHHFAWGSKTSIPNMLGIDATSDPVAEAWFGDMSTVVGDDGGRELLADLLARDERPGQPSRRSTTATSELPFLVKFLAADRPLSIQVHPDAATARLGFERENSLGIPVEDPSRVYRDPNSKPEAILALEDFEMLAGFRAPAEAAVLLDALDIPQLRSVADLLRTDDGQSLHQAVEAVYAMDSEAVSGLGPAIAEACSHRAPPGDSRQCEWVRSLAESFPQDAGVAIALLMNYVSLRRFDLAFVDVGTVHSYLRGLGLEVMGNSDNVVRGGLTPKHVDVPELLRVADLVPGGPDVTRFDLSPEFGISTDRFALTLIELDAATTDRQAHGPEILVTLDGAASITTSTPGSMLGLPSGTAAYVNVGDDRYQLSGTAVLARIQSGTSVGERG